MIFAFRIGWCAVLFIPSYTFAPIRIKSFDFRLFAADPDLNSSDPFRVLGLEATADRAVIKKAYKRMALRYHPDVQTTKDSTPEQKKRASAQFAKINWAYEQLKADRQAAASASSSSSSTTNDTSGWTPPHRRTSSYTTSRSSGASTDWRDYMPNYDDDDNYDTDGDSFGTIFSDLFKGGAVSGAKVVSDFVDFLENTVDGYGSSSASGGSYDELETVLRTGTIDQVGEEMEETELVVQQLQTKKTNVADEVVMLEAEKATATKFSERLSLEEKIEELKARQRVVENYLGKARKRLLSLQTRYKELIVRRGDDPNARRGSRPSADAASSSRSSTPPRDEEDKWRDEGFGSRRGRGSSRRRANRTGTSTDREPASTTYSTTGSSNQNRTEPRSRSPPTPNPEANVPPHRRKTTSYSSTDDKKRLRELQVEDEFEKLKRDLGL